MFQETSSISQFRSVNDPDEPLDGLKKSERDRFWLLLSRRIHALVTEDAALPARVG
jgi:hypothetical protein